MKILDRILGPREATSDDEHQVNERAREAELRAALSRHRRTLQAVRETLSDSDRALVLAIDETGAAIELTSHRTRRR